MNEPTLVPLTGADILSMMQNVEPEQETTFIITRPALCGKSVSEVPVNIGIAKKP